MSESSRGFGYWLNIFANLAVVAGIVFLGLELRQSSQMMRAQTRHEMANDVVDLLTFGLTDREYLRVMVEGSLGEALTPIEGMQFSRSANAWLRYWEDVHYQYRNGLYDETEFLTQKGAMRNTLSRPGWIDYWCESRDLYSREFAEMIDSFVDSSC